MTKTQCPQIELFDTHAHLDRIDCCYKDEAWFQTRDHDRFPSAVNINDGYIEKHDFQMAGILWPGIMLESSNLSVEFAERNELCYAAVGIHPNCTGQVGHNDWSEIVELSKNPCVSAIGETGLDRYWDTVPFEIQVKYFERHLELAKERNLPVLIHCRDCDGDMIEILSNLARVSSIFGIIHSFSSTPEVAEKFLEMGLYISFSGTVTYPNKKFASLHEAAKIIPEDRLLVETDSPFLIPHPYRGKLDDNLPIMTAYTVGRLALLRRTTIKHISEVTTENARRIFRKK